MKRIKIQRGYLAKKQPKKAKYYDQSLGANTVLPPRELLMHKTREEKDMGRLLSYVNALQSLSKPEKAWYENLAKKSKSGWEKVKDYLSKMNLLYSYDDWDKEYEEAMREERARREKDMKKDKVKIVPTDDSRISQILRDIEQSRKKENISKYFLERDRERYRRTIPSDDDEVVVDDDDEDEDEDEGEYDDEDEDEGEYDVTDDDDDDEKGSPHQNKKNVLDENPDVEEIWMPDGSKVFKNKEVPNSALTTRETPQNVSMRPVNDSSITLTPLGSDRRLVAKRNDPPLGATAVSQGNSATSLSSGEQDALAHANRVSKSLQQQLDMEIMQAFQSNLHDALTSRRRDGKMLSADEIKYLVNNPEILKHYLHDEMPSSLSRIWKQYEEGRKFDQEMSRFVNSYYMNYEYLLRNVLPTIANPRTRISLAEPAAAAVGNTLGKYLEMIKRYPNADTSKTQQYIDGIKKLIQTLN